MRQSADCVLKEVVIQGSRNGARAEWGNGVESKERLFCIFKIGCHCIFVCCWM